MKPAAALLALAVVPAENAMRHQIVVLLLLLLATTALASAQEPSPDVPDLPDGEFLQGRLGDMIGESYTPLALTLVESPDAPEAPPATDSCSDAPALNLGAVDSGQTTVNNMGESASDPVLSCMWGNPVRPQGFRTVWYRFTPPVSGIATIRTRGSTYDTVLAVYAGSCGSLAVLACDDDTYEFTSEVNVPVLEGQTYYVEVASWHFGVNGTENLLLSAWVKTVSNWVFVNTMDLPRTRHAAVVHGKDIYVIGGQYYADNTPVRSHHTSVYHTETNSWESRLPMLGPDGFGYSNTTAALVDGRIYIPAGYVGDNDTYDGHHWVYDITANTWCGGADNPCSPAVSQAPWPGGRAFAYAYAVPYDQPSGRYFLTGGLDGPPLSGTSNPRPELFMYVPASNIWLNLEPMQTSRYAHVAALQRIGGQDHICVVGGLTSINNQPFLLAGGECYNIATDQWTLTTGSLNFPRFNAASAVGPDGRWYVYGGTDATFRSVAVTEVYDPATNSWIALDSGFDLATQDPNALDRPARSWPRGGFVGNTLWAIGGHRNVGGNEIIMNLVEKLFIPDHLVYFPIVQLGAPDGEPDDSFATARPIAIGQVVFQNFDGPEDFFDTYTFHLAGTATVTVHLSDIPGGSNYDFHFYNRNKVYYASGLNVGNNPEVMTFANLPPGQYFILVERVFPTGDPNPANYRLEITN